MIINILGTSKPNDKQGSQQSATVTYTLYDLMTLDLINCII